MEPITIIIIIAIVVIAIAMMYSVKSRKSVSSDALYSEALSAILKDDNKEARERTS